MHGGPAFAIRLEQEFFRGRKTIRRLSLRMRAMLPEPAIAGW